MATMVSPSVLTDRRDSTVSAVPIAEIMSPPRVAFIERRHSARGGWRLWWWMAPATLVLSVASWVGIKRMVENARNVPSGPGIVAPVHPVATPANHRRAVSAPTRRHARIFVVHAVPQASGFRQLSAAGVEHPAPQWSRLVRAGPGNLRAVFSASGEIQLSWDPTAQEDRYLVFSAASPYMTEAAQETKEPIPTPYFSWFPQESDRMVWLSVRALSPSGRLSGFGAPLGIHLP